ncbi:FHA domain-containing protein [Chitinimonas lacunae]|uniref:FHA domain-containing protein n=1 Tax=Chitinimonas lacunae TaxID=1963018 RepID=A0ABV8MVQ2_9NEIS
MKIFLSDRPATAGFFDRDDGGTIGRAPANHLMLQGFADISQVHASIERINGKWLVKDLGDLLPVLHNGRALGYGRRADLNDGDELRIGEAVLKVDLHATDHAASRSAAPPSHLVPTAVASVAEPMLATAIPQTASTATAASGTADPFAPSPTPSRLPDDFDPLATATTQTASTSTTASGTADPFALNPTPSRLPDDFDPLATATTQTASTATTASGTADPFAPSPTPSRLPADFDPFAPPLAQSTSSAPAPRPDSTALFKLTPAPDRVDPLAKPATSTPAPSRLPDDFDLLVTPTPTASTDSFGQFGTQKPIEHKPEVATSTPAPIRLPDDFDPLAPTPASNNHGISLEEFAATAAPPPPLPPVKPDDDFDLLGSRTHRPTQFTSHERSPLPAQATDPFASNNTPQRSPQVDPFSLFNAPAAATPQPTASVPPPPLSLPADFDPLAGIDLPPVETPAPAPQPAPVPTPKATDPFADTFAFRSPPPPPPQSAYHALMEAAAPKPLSSSPPPSASMLAALQEDPFSAKPAPISPSNRLGVDPLGLETENLLNPMHHRDNLDPTRHKTESIDDLFGLGSGGTDPLAPGGVFDLTRDPLSSDSNALDLLSPQLPPQQTTQADHTPGIHSTMSIIPASGQAAAQPRPASPAPAPIPVASPAPAPATGQQDSLDDLFGLGKDSGSSKSPF